MTLFRFLPQPAVIKEHYLIIAGHRIKAWYPAPYPEVNGTNAWFQPSHAICLAQKEYAILQDIYLCEFCLKYMSSAEEFSRHPDRCTTYGRPPGDEIFRQDDMQFWEVDGSKSKVNFCFMDVAGCLNSLIYTLLIKRFTAKIFAC